MRSQVVHVLKTVSLWWISDNKGVFMQRFVPSRGSQSEILTQYGDKCKYLLCYLHCCWCLKGELEKNKSNDVFLNEHKPLEKKRFRWLLWGVNMVNNVLVSTGRGQTSDVSYSSHGESFWYIDCICNISSRSLNYASFWQTLIISYCYRTFPFALTWSVYDCHTRRSARTALST